MNAVSAQLKRTRFLMGNRPTAVDCIVLAGLRAHFLYDPVPNRELRPLYPDVAKWVESLADRWPGDGALAPFPESTDFVRFVLKEMASSWGPFAQGNRRAIDSGSRAFVVSMYGEDVSYLARPYVEQSRRMVVRRVEDELSTQERHQLEELLSASELVECFR
ncbi:MAG: glutathione binding-like protein [Myxococcota bacterium]